MDEWFFTEIFFSLCVPSEMGWMNVLCMKNSLMSFTFTLFSDSVFFYGVGKWKWSHDFFNTNSVTHIYYFMDECEVGNGTFFCYVVKSNCRHKLFKSQQHRSVKCPWFFQLLWWWLFLLFTKVSINMCWKFTTKKFIFLEATGSAALDTKIHACFVATFSCLFLDHPRL